MIKPGTEWQRRVFGAGYVTPEQRRERDIDEAVREGLNLSLAEDGCPYYLPYLLQNGFPPRLHNHIRQAWREQHA